MISLQPNVCDNCGGSARGKMGEEILYLATTAVDGPWLCLYCRDDGDVPRWEDEGGK